MISQRAAAAASMDSFGEFKPPRERGRYGHVVKQPQLKTVAVMRYVTMILAAMLGILVGVMLADGGSEVCPQDATQSKYQGEVGTEGMVATTNKFATQIGLQVLRNGGNAADAAAAIQFALTVAQPQSTGIGGGCFVMHYKRSTGVVTAIDGREEAPAAFHGKMFCKDKACMTNSSCECIDGALPWEDRVPGGNSVGVPGTVAAVDLMLKNHGSQKHGTMAKAVEPAVKLARQGFTMYPHLHEVIGYAHDKLDAWPGARKIYITPKYKVGDTFTNQELAETLESIGDGGAKAFYEGSIAEDIVRTVRESMHTKTGKYGVMSTEDLKGYRAVHRRPTEVPVRAHGQCYTVYGMPMPSSGGIGLAQMLTMMQGLGLESYQAAELDTFHRLLDTQNVAFADRNKYLGDSDFIDVPVDGLLDPEYCKSRAEQLMRLWRATPTPIAAGSPPGATPAMRKLHKGTSQPEHGTSHFVVVDKWGDIVSTTTTIEANFGSGLAVRGFMLNNELTDFDPLLVDPTTGQRVANGPEGGKRRRHTTLLPSEQLSFGGKRPRSSMTPTLVVRDTTHAACGRSGSDSSSSSSSNGKEHAFQSMGIGSPGGSMIIGAVLNVLVNFLYFGETLPAAVNKPRAIGRNDQHNLVDYRVNTTRPAMVRGLQERGFGLHLINYTGYVQGVWVDERKQPTSSDSAGNGMAQPRTRIMYGVADHSRLPSALAKGLCKGGSECPLHLDSPYAEAEGSGSSIGGDPEYARRLFPFLF